MTHGRPFNIYRIVCVDTGTALVSGSNNQRWYGEGEADGRFWRRGQWTKTGQFWRTPETVRRHLMNLCHNWKVEYRFGAVIPPTMDYQGNYRPPYQLPTKEIKKRLTVEPNLERLDHLRVEVTTVNDYAVTEIAANEFMNIQSKIMAD